MARNQPVFIGGATRSGTTLMLALLDGHPELVVFPEECNYFNYSAEHSLRYGVLSSLFKESVKGKSKALEAMRGNLSSVLANGERIYDDFDFSEFVRIAQELFSKHDSSHGRENARVAAVQAMIGAYNQCWEQKEDARWVMKTPRYERYWRDIFSDFPKANMICMIRDPRDVATSRTLKSKRGRYLKNGGVTSEWSPQGELDKLSFKQIEEWEQSVDDIYNAQRCFPSKVLGVSYERLTREPACVMQEIASFLGITNDEVLVKPTIRNRLWEGNSSFGKKYEHIETRSDPQRVSVPTFRNWQVEAWLGAEKLEKWGYTPASDYKKLNLKSLMVRMDEYESFYGNRVRMITNWWKDRNRSGSGSE